jgi:hypothetical protein
MGYDGGADLQFATPQRLARPISDANGRLVAGIGTLLSAGWCDRRHMALQSVLVDDAPGSPRGSVRIARRSTPRCSALRADAAAARRDPGRVDRRIDGARPR